MTIFSPDGKYGYIVSSFTPEMVVVDTKSHKVVGKVRQASPFSPDLAATPDGKQVWLTLKDIGKTQVINARPPFNTLAVLDTGAITNHVNIARNAHGQFAYVTVGGLNQVKVFTTGDKPELVATIPVGPLPHGLWPSGDGTRMFVGLENGNAVTAIDTLANKVVASIPTGQSPQGMVYVPQAVPEGPGTDNLAPLGSAGEAVHLAMGPVGSQGVNTTVTVNNQGLVDLLQAAATGLEPKKSYVLALAMRADGSGPLEPIATFMGNPAGAAAVTTLGPLRRAVSKVTQATEAGAAGRRYLVIAAQGADGKPGEVVQVQR
jgi:YVTN family beta-propeller protein